MELEFVFFELLEVLRVWDQFVEEFFVLRGDVDKMKQVLEVELEEQWCYYQCEVGSISE